MAYRPRFGTRRRETLYQCEALAAHRAGRGDHPICVHCDQPVLPTQSWDESHVAVPAALGGKRVGVGHRLCNRLDNNKTVTPMVARVKRKRLRHLGITGPGLGRHPLPGGCRSNVSKSVAGAVQPRLTLGQKMAALRARRSFEQPSAQQE